MIRRIIANTTSAAALCLTTLAAGPVVADNYTRDRVIAGAVLLGIIGLAIQEQRQEREQRAPTVTQPRPAPQVYHPQPAQRQYNPTPLSRVPSEGQGYRDPALLPVQCFQQLHTDDGLRHVFDAECLEYHYPFARFLPGGCAGTVRVNGQHPAIYWPRCLRDSGYRLAGR